MAGTLAFVRRLAGSIALLVALMSHRDFCCGIPADRTAARRGRDPARASRDDHRAGRSSPRPDHGDPHTVPAHRLPRTHARSPARAPSSRLNTSSLASKAYVAKLQRAQRAAAATLKRAIPEATVRRNYTILLNGMAVELPATELARAAKLSFARKLYPSYRYTLALDRSPGLIGAGARGRHRRRNGRRGGEDRGRRRRRRSRSNRFFDPEGFSYPAGFPKGGRNGRRRR